MRANQSGDVDCQQIADPFDCQIGGRIGRNSRRVIRECALAWKNRRDTVAPRRLEGAEDAQFVVDQHIMPCGISALDVVQCVLLVDIDQNPVVDGPAETRSLDLARLEERIAVGQNDRRPPLRKSCRTSSALG